MENFLSNIFGLGESNTGISYDKRMNGQIGNIKLNLGVVGEEKLSDRVPMQGKGNIGA